MEHMLKPINDLAKIKLDSDPYGFGGDRKDTAESGILYELPDKFNYYGFWSFAFEDSFMSHDKLEELYKYWGNYLGYRVYWTALSEKGNIIAIDKERYAFVKLTSLIAVSDDPDEVGHNIHSDGAGGFKV